MAARFLPGNQQFPGLSEPIELEGNRYQQQLEDDFFNFDTFGEDEVDSTGVLQNRTSFTDCLSSFDETVVRDRKGMTKERGEVLSPVFAPETWSTSLTHCTTPNTDDTLELSTIDPRRTIDSSMSERSPVLLNASAFATDYTHNHICPFDLSQESRPSLV
jgi:hypothetical protein